MRTCYEHKLGTRMFHFHPAWIYIWKNDFLVEYYLLLFLFFTGWINDNIWRGGIWNAYRINMQNIQNYMYTWQIYSKENKHNGMGYIRQPRRWWRQLYFLFPFNPFFNYNCYIEMSFLSYNSSLLNSESEIDPSYAEMITKDQAFYIFQFTLYTLVCSIIQIFGYI